MTNPAKEPDGRRSELLLAALVAVGLVAVLGTWLPAGTAHEPATIQLDVEAHDNNIACGLDQGECWFEIVKDGEALDGESPELPLTRGATVEVTFTNEGSMGHSFEIGGGCCGDGGYGGSDTISPGETDTYTFQVPWDADDAGDYWCRPHGHAMKGSVSADGGNADPTLTVDSPTEGATVEGVVEIAGTSGDADGDTVTVEVQVPPDDSWQAADGTDAWNATWNTSLVDNGDHTIEVRTVDQHGFETLVERTVTVANPLPPEIGIDRPAEMAQVTGNVTVEGTASDPDGDLDHVEVRLPPDDAWRTADGTTGWSTAWNATGLEPGTYTLRARAVDSEGLTAATNVTVELVAPGRPRVTVTSPADGATVEGVVAVNGTAEDPEGALSRVEVRVDDGPWRTADGTATWNLTVELAPGDHRIEARAVAGDRTSPQAAVTVTVPSSSGDGDGNGTASTGGPVGAPGNVTVSPQGDGFVVRWDPVPNATAYRVQRDVGDGFETVARTTGTSYEDGRVPTGEAPRYRVVAVGSNATAASETVTAGEARGPPVPLPVWVTVVAAAVATIARQRRR